MLAQFADQQAISVNWFCGEPRLLGTNVAPQEVWLPGHLAPLTVPATPEAWRTSLDAMALTLRWIIAYEKWVIAEVGPDYRTACLARWPRTVCEAAEIILAWEQLASACEQPVR